MATSLRWLLAVGSLAVALAILWMWRPGDPREPREGTLAEGAAPDAEDLRDGGGTTTAATLDLLDHRASAREHDGLASAGATATSTDDLTVLVRSVDGNPCRGARVHVEGCAVGAAPASKPAWSTVRTTDASGRARFERAELRSDACIVLRATAEPRTASEEVLFAGAREVPRAVTLQLERTFELKVTVSDREGLGLQGAKIVLASKNGHAPLVREEATATSGGRWSLFAPRGDYEIAARADWLPAEARKQLTVRGDRPVFLFLEPREVEELAVAVSGVVVDEHGRGLVGVPLTSVLHEHVTGRPSKASRGRSTVSGERGEFEIRTRACDEVELHVGGDPLLAAFEKNPARVAWGTTGLVLRRARAWEPNKIRIHAIDAVSKAEVAAPTFTMRLVSDAGGQRIFQGRDGWIDAQVPWRDDVAWKVDAFGYFAAEGPVAGLASRLKDGTLELELERDPKEVQKAAAAPAAIAVDGATRLPAHPR